MTKTDSGVEVGRLGERVEVVEFRQVAPEEPITPDNVGRDDLIAPISGGVGRDALGTPRLTDAGAYMGAPGASRPTGENPGAAWDWETVRRTWARAELMERKNVWSVHGIGAAGVRFTLRRQPIDLDSALRWRGQHCLITAIRPLGRLYLTVEAALVELYPCRDPRDGTTFPAVVTEEYLGHQQLEPMAVNTHRRVLVTPKAIRLSPGPLVEVDGVPWPILTPYELDPHRNEYVVGRTVDL